MLYHRICEISLCRILLDSLPTLLKKYAAREICIRLVVNLFTAVAWNRESEFAKAHVTGHQVSWRSWKVLLKNTPVTVNRVLRETSVVCVVDLIGSNSTPVDRGLYFPRLYVPT